MRENKYGKSEDNDSYKNNEIVKIWQGKLNRTD